MILPFHPPHHTPTLFSPTTLLHSKVFTKVLPVEQSYRQLSKTARLLVLVNGIVAIGLGFGGVFFGIYLWRQSHSLGSIALFSLMQCPTLLFCFFLAGSTWFRKSFRFYKCLGIILFGLGYLALLLLQNQALDFIIPLGLLFGLADGFYWVGNHAYVYLETKDRNRDEFNSLLFSLESIFSIVIPPIAGAIVSLTLPSVMFSGYYLLFALAIGLLLLAYALARKLPEIGSPQVEIKEITSLLKEPFWKTVFLRSIVEGFKDGSEPLIGGMLVFFILTKELHIGIFNSVFALLAALLAVKIGTILNRENRLKVAFIGILLSILGHSLLIAFFSVPGLILSSIITLFASLFYSLGLFSSFLDAIDYGAKQGKNFFNCVLIREIPLDLSRIAGLVLLLFVLQQADQVLVAKLWFLSTRGLAIIYYYLTVKFEAKIDA